MNSEVIERIACIGAGTIGSSWATYFLIKGLSVNIQDINDKALEESKRKINNNLDYLRGNNVISNKQYENVQKNVKFTTEIKEAVSGVQFIQESALEKYDIKKNIIEEIDKYKNEDVIIASSSSGLLVSKLQMFSKHPENVIIAHPFNPPHLIPLVELVRGKASERTLEIANQFYKKIGKIPIVLNKEVPGHVANRIQAAVWRESIDLVLNGVCSVEDVDAAVCYGPGLRWALMGPNMIFNLGGGNKGIEGFLGQFRSSFETWWDDMADWKKFPENCGEILSLAIEKEMASSSIEDKVKWRDSNLISILKSLELI